MRDALRRVVDDDLAMCVDSKVNVTSQGYVVATLSLLTKDTLRRTTQRRSTGGRAQGYAQTTHAVPVLQAGSSKCMMRVIVHFRVRRASSQVPTRT